jgi:integrase
VVIQTRWHRDDLTGRLLQQARTIGQRWRVVKFPAVAEEHDVLGRAPGEALWPEMYFRERLRTLTIHHGRHTFISHALAGGGHRAPARSLAEVRDAAGHSNVSVTSAYLHVAVDDDGRPGNLFRFK